MPETRLGYVPALDGLRGMAILMVMAYHTLVRPFIGGFLGVDLFFVLSGFLITAILLQEWQATYNVSLRRFHLKRALRLLPGLLAVIAISLAALLAHVPQRDPAAAFDSLAVLGFVANWVQVARDGAFRFVALANTWSLAIEGQFYLLWPITLAWLLRRGVRLQRLALCLALLALAVALWRALQWRGPQSCSRLYYATDTRCDGLLLGSAAACLFALRPLARPVLRALRFAAWPAFYALILMAVSAQYGGAFVYQAGILLASLSATALVLHVVLWPQSFVTRLLACRPLVAVGRISYGLYLWHGVINTALHALPYNLPMAALRFALAFLAAALSYRFVEQPALRAKDRLPVPQVHPHARMVHTITGTGPYSPRSS